MVKEIRGIKYLKDVWNGERCPTQQSKFKTIYVILGFIHIILTIYFFVCDFKFIAVYNVFSAIYYWVSSASIEKTPDMFGAFLGAYIEIIGFSSVITVLLGWDFGFMLYVISLCPGSFFITYTLPGRKRSLSAPMIFSLISMIIYLLVRFYTEHYGIVLSREVSHDLVNFCNTFNSLVAFMSTIALSSFFALELRAQEKELEKQNSKLTSISSIDPLTGLFNRRSMDKFLEEQVNTTKSTGALFTIAICDIDNFKKVNDIHGHNVGDDVLVMVATTLKDTLPEDCTLCRWGGEEFLILLPLKEDESIPTVESLRVAVAKQIVKVEKPDGILDLGVTMTFGMSQYIHGFSIEKIISIADENLYIGKENGKNRVVHSKTVIEHNRRATDPK